VVNPLVSFIWVGFLVLVVGTVLALTRGRARAQAPKHVVPLPKLVGEVKSEGTGALVADGRGLLARVAERTGTARPTTEGHEDPPSAERLSHRRALARMLARTLVWLFGPGIASWILGANVNAEAARNGESGRGFFALAWLGVLAVWALLLFVVLRAPLRAGPVILYMTGTVILGAMYGVVLVFQALGQREREVSGAASWAAWRALATEQERLLRAMSDLEFDRAVGKVSLPDYEAMMADYRQRAAEIERGLREPVRPVWERVEAAIAERRQRMQELTAAPAADTQTGPAPGEPDKAQTCPAPGEPEEPRAASSRLACPSCGSSNDADALYCKRCGTRIEKHGDVT